MAESIFRSKNRLRCNTNAYVFCAILNATTQTACVCVCILLFFFVFFNRLACFGSSGHCELYVSGRSFSPLNVAANMTSHDLMLRDLWKFSFFARFRGKMTSRDLNGNPIFSLNLAGK